MFRERCLAAWCLAASLSVLGSQSAHQLAYRLVTPDAQARAQLLAQTGHSYMEYAPLAMAVLSVAALSGLVSVARMSVPGRAPSLWVFATFAPSVFLCQECLERAWHDSAVPWDALTQPSVLAGLALQLPFALAAYAAARLLLGVARGIGRALRSRSVWPRVGVVGAVARRSALVRARRIGILARGYAERGPPVLPG